MRIKKKHVLLEAYVLDLSDEFSPYEKKLLKILYKKYGTELYKKNFNLWEVAAMLIEDFNLDYEDAYNLSKTYRDNHYLLFKEHEPLRIKSPKSLLFFERVDELVQRFIDGKTEDHEFGTVSIKFDVDELPEEREVMVWTGYKGFTLYLPLSIDTIHPWEQRDARGIMVRIKFAPLDSNNNPIEGWISDKEHEQINNQKFKVDVTYRVGESREFDGTLFTFEEDYPEKINQEKSFEIFDRIIEKVVNKLSNTEFTLKRI